MDAGAALDPKIDGAAVSAAGAGTEVGAAVADGADVPNIFDAGAPNILAPVLGAAADSAASSGRVRFLSG